jgi:hypothetical protein
MKQGTSRHNPTPRVQIRTLTDSNPSPYGHASATPETNPNTNNKMKQMISYNWFPARLIEPYITLKVALAYLLTHDLGARTLPTPRLTTPNTNSNHKNQKS